MKTKLEIPKCRTSNETMLVWGEQAKRGTIKGVSGWKCYLCGRILKLRKHVSSSAYYMVPRHNIKAP